MFEKSLLSVSISFPFEDIGFARDTIKEDETLKVDLVLENLFQANF